ncbi:GNAT family N-acetyltransferase [Psychromicrobium sp. YIM B11713]|uniref:GNAT family N-acetyltransferase n=1 Tax=Psychromicrobium sp. YIM B11713 TaxID=3145233 RepID=UPI00374E7164
MSKPQVSELGQALAVLAEWQDDEASFQLHPGDLGWFWRFGAEATAAAVRCWSRAGKILALGLLDGPQLLRLTIAPQAQQDEELAERLVRDLVQPEHGVLPAGKAHLETPSGVLLRELLTAVGWQPDELWTPLRRELDESVPDPVMRIEVIGAEKAQRYATVVRAAFDGSSFTPQRWRAMASGSPYAEARSLIGYDDRENAVAVATVWSAGQGRPGLLEPMGVHHDHRGHGYGKAISLAAAAALLELGSSSALVCTPSSNTGGIATYRSAGFRPLPERLDLRREA